MQPKKLTIAIPTYNRPGPLAETLRQLNAQEGFEECEVIVSDNASEQIMEQVMGNDFPELTGAVRFHRNLANLGVTGNILRCIELSTSEWIWILADDDDLDPHAVRHLLKSCEDAIDLDFVVFSQAENQKGGVRVSSTTELLQEIDYWHRMGFLPVGMYRVSSIREVLNVGATYAYTLFPHVSMLFHGLEAKGWKGALDSFVPVIAAHKGADFWPLMLAINGYVTAELVDSEKNARAILRLASKWCLGPIGLTHEFLRLKQIKGKGLPRLSYKHKMFLIRQVSFRYRLAAYACHFASYLPPSLTLSSIGMIRKLTGRATELRPNRQDVYGRI